MSPHRAVAVIAVRGSDVVRDRRADGDAAVLEIIERAQAQGYATESEESCMGVRCFGVALPFTHQTVDALSVAVPISRLDNGREDFIIETLLSVKARLAAVHGNSLVR